MRQKIWRADNFAKLIRPKRKLTCRGYLCVLLTQTSGTSIAGIGRHALWLFAIAHAFFILAQLCFSKFLECLDRHIYLATHFEHARHCNTRFRIQLFRYHTDRAHVGRHVFTNLAVTTCRRLNKLAILVANAQRQTVNLQFAGKLHRHIVKTFSRTLAPCLQLSSIHRIIKTRHRHAVCYRVKGCCARTNYLSWRNIVTQLWIFRL